MGRSVHVLQAILPEKHMIDDRAHAHCGRAVNNYFVRSIVRGRIRFTGARNNCVIGYKGLNYFNAVPLFCKLHRPCK